MHYCIVRGDLPRGLQAAQLIHAAGESSPGNLPPNTFAIALQARDEAHLLALGAVLSSAGIPHHPIRESDAPYAGALVAIGLAPMERSRARKLLSSLPLVK